MNLKDKKIGFCLTGSFCTFTKTIEQIKLLIKEEAIIIPIMSFSAYNYDTKFGKANDFINEIEGLTGNKIIHTIQEAEPIGPLKMTDIMIVAPCSRKYIRKIKSWNNRWTGINGSKVSLEKQQSIGNSSVY